MSSETPAIEVAGAGKTYRLYARPADRLKQALFGARRRYFSEFDALSGVDFSLGRGEAMGIVGVNGAGKSTLLQLIAGTISPTHGTVRTCGRVAALLELGSGFNPEFSGRENIYLNAATLGLSKREIDERVESIIEFAGIGAHIDQPVKTYSSGMYVRLAFAIATSVEPDVLIIDEALSVGDGAFARKSFDRIMQIKERGATVLFCSHTLFHVEVFCDRALWLHEGRVRAAGDVSRVLAQYQEFLDGLGDARSVGAAHAVAAGNSGQDALSERDGAGGTASAASPGAARIADVGVSLDGQHGAELYGASGRSVLRMSIDFASDPGLPAPTAALVLSTDGGRILATCFSSADGTELARDARGQGTATIEVRDLPLSKGRFRVGAYLLCERGVHVYQWIDPVAHLNLHREGHDQGYLVLAGQWSSSNRVARHWDDWQQARSLQAGNFVDWGDHPTVLAGVFQAAFGRPDVDFFDFLHEHYPQCSRAHALSLCCGDGSFERTLLQRGVFQRVTGLEISPARIAHGKDELQRHPGLSERLDFVCSDVNLGQYGTACYDVVFAKAALHHIENLEEALAGMRRCLRPGGLLITIDFFGPSRFQWTDAQLDACNAFWESRVPAELRFEADGRVTPPIERPSIQSMIDMDPSEAVRSGDLYAMLKQHFVLEQDFSLGGTVLNLLLYGSRVNRFDPQNPVHNDVLGQALAFERGLIADGALGSDFRFIVARPR